jgi:molecular chaperone DnaK (HSP70)
MEDNTFMNDFEHIMNRAKYFASKAEELSSIGKEKLKSDEEFEITINLTDDELEELKGLVNEARLMYLTVLIANTDALLSGEEIPPEVKEFRDMLEKLPDALEKIYEGYKILIEE